MKYQKLRATAVGFIGLVVLLPMAASAATMSYDVLDSQSQPGMLMSLTSSSGVVERSNEKNASSLVGVLVTNNSDLTQQPGQVSVQNDGSAEVLVSTLGGDILVGDRIAPSSIAGVGAKAGKRAWIVGTAQGSLSSKTKGAVASTVVDSKGGKHKVYLARVPVVLHVTYYTDGSGAAADNGGASNIIQKAADAIAGKRASSLGLVLSILLMISGIFFAGQVINSSFRGAFAAISRQPLTKAVVLGMVLKSTRVALLIIIVGCVGALLVLRFL